MPVPGRWECRLPADESTYGVLMDTHHDDKKIQPLVEPVAPEPFVRRWLHDQTDGNPADVRILDIGCGRGDTVAWLCEHGFHAYGVDPCSEYVDNGATYFADRGYGKRLFSFGSSYPFPDHHFDVVLSVQVLEHVADIDAFAHEVARVSRPGARGLHVLPGRWRPVEPHLKTPPFHWLPKGRTQEELVRLFVKSGVSEKVRHRPTDEWVQYAQEHLHYRTSGAIRASLERHGLQCDLSTSSRRKLVGRLPWLPRWILPTAAVTYGLFGTSYMETVRCSQAPVAAPIAEPG